MRNKNEQNVPAKAEETKNNDLDIHEIDMDEACDVVGGVDGGCTGCGGGCATSPTEPPLNQM